MAKGWGYHVCAGCRRAHAVRGLCFPLTCDCGHVSKSLRSANVEVDRGYLDDGRGRDALRGGGCQVRRTPLLD